MKNKKWLGVWIFLTGFLLTGACAQPQRPVETGASGSLPERKEEGVKSEEIAERREEPTEAIPKSRVEPPASRPETPQTAPQPDPGGPGRLAETLYVKKSGTRLRAEATAQSAVLKVLNQGTVVRLVEKSGRFYHVATPAGTKGWVFKFKLTPKPPASPSGGDDLFGVLGGEGQMAVQESASGSSIRGLSPTSEKHARSKGISESSIQAVKNMERFHVTEKEMDRFLAEGRLGEFGP